MKRLIVSIKDVKLGEFLGLSLVKNVDEAHRHFLALLEQPSSRLNTHPTDYQMWRLGDMDTETGVVNPGIPGDLTPYTEVGVFLRDRELVKGELSLTPVEREQILAQRAADEEMESARKDREKKRSPGKQGNGTFRLEA